MQWARWSVTSILAAGWGALAIIALRVLLIAVAGVAAGNRMIRAFPPIPAHAAGRRDT